MSTSTETKIRHRWDEDAYDKIDRARCDWDGNVLTVDFQDGDRVQLDPKLLVPRSANPDEVDWWRIGSNEAEVLIPIGPSWFEVPSDVIRDITDPEFSEHWTQMDQKFREKRGERIRELRERQELSVEALAEQAGVAVGVVESVESGTYGPDVDPTPIITALGRKWSNLYDWIAIDDDFPEEAN